jgi:hypothetical protein
MSVVLNNCDLSRDYVFGLFGLLVFAVRVGRSSI